MLLFRCHLRLHKVRPASSAEKVVVQYEARQGAIDGKGARARAIAPSPPSMLLELRSIEVISLLARRMRAIAIAPSVPVHV